jgi:hypothetical protein
MRRRNRQLPANRLCNPPVRRDLLWLRRFKPLKAFLNKPHVDRLAEPSDSAAELVAFLDAQFAGRHRLQDGADCVSRVLGKALAAIHSADLTLPASAALTMTLVIATMLRAIALPATSSCRAVAGVRRAVRLVICQSCLPILGTLSCQFGKRLLRLHAVGHAAKPPCEAAVRAGLDSRNQARRLPPAGPRDGDAVKLFTRRGYDWTERYAAIATAAAKLKARSLTLDGEAVVCDGDGVAVFGALHRRSRARGAARENV